MHVCVKCPCCALVTEPTLVQKPTLAAVVGVLALLLNMLQFGNCCMAVVWAKACAANITAATGVFADAPSCPDARRLPC
jgi:hypothetical protein